MVGYKKVKVYSVTFVQYTNCMRDTVWNEEDDEYLKVGRDPFLVREDELDYYKKFGDGFETIRLVGYMAIDLSKDEKEKELFYLP